MSKNSKQQTALFVFILGKRAHYASPLISSELIKMLQLFSYAVKKRCYCLHESLHILFSHNTLLYDHPAKPKRKGVDDILLTLTLPGPSAGVSGSLDSYCSLKPLCSGMGEVVPARTSPTLLPPIPSHCAVIILFQSVAVHQLP